jgi:hypothetical protein
MNFFSKTFWLGTTLVTFNVGDWVMASVFGAFLVLALVFRVLKALSPNVVLQRLYRRLFSGLLTCALVGGLWVGLRFWLVPYLGSRIVAGLILVGFLIWLGFILHYLFTRLGKEKAEWEQRQVRDRYLKGQK